MAQADDDHDAPDPLDEHRAREEFGITTHPMGTWMPEGSYRPVPIVWLGGAWFVQVFALIALWLLLLSKAPVLTAATGGMVTIAIGHWTWARGMAGAGFGWRALTVAVLGLNFLMVSVAAYASR